METTWSASGSVGLCVAGLARGGEEQAVERAPPQLSGGLGVHSAMPLVRWGLRERGDRSSGRLFVFPRRVFVPTAVKFMIGPSGPGHQ